MILTSTLNHILISVLLLLLVSILWWNNQNPLLRRRLEYLRKESEGNLISDSKVLSYGADVAHDSQHAPPPIIPGVETATRENFTEESRLSNRYNTLVFPQLRQLESHILNENAVVDDFSLFKQEDLIQLFKTGLKHGELVSCPNYIPENVYYGNNIYEAIEAAITNFLPIYFLEFSSASGLTSVTNYMSLKFPSLVGLHVYFAKEEDRVVDSAQTTCKPLLSESTFLISGNDYDSKDFLSSQKYSESSYERIPNSDQCIQYLQSYHLIARNLLPFEFEIELGNFLCHCQVSYIPSVFPASDPYYSHWESAQSLIKNAINAARTCFKDKEIVVKAQIESYVMPVRNGFEVIVVTPSKSTGTDGLPSSSSNETISTDEFNEFSKSFPWEWLQTLPLDYQSRIKFSRKILYDRIYATNDTKTVDQPIQNNTTDNQSSKLEMEESIEVKYTDESPVPLQMDSQQLMAINHTLDTSDSVKLNSPAASEKKPDDDLKSLDPALIGNTSTATATATVSFNQNNTVMAMRRKLWPLSTVTNSNNKYSTTSKTSTTSAAMAKEDVDILETNEFNFAWKLLDDNQHILDLKDHPPATTNDADQHDLMVKYYNEIINEGKITFANEYTLPNYHLTMKTRMLQKLIYQSEKTVYQSWKDLFTLENSMYSSSIRNIFWNDLSSSRSIYFLGERLSLTSLKLISRLTTPVNMKSTKYSRKMKRNYPTNPNFIAASFFMDTKTAKTHYQLGKLMNIHNNFVFHPNWDMSLLYAWIGSTERGDVSVIESDVIITVISMVYEYSSRSSMYGDLPIEQQCSIDLVYEALSVVFSLSSVTYVHLPTLKEFQKAIEIVAPNCYAYYLQENLIPSATSSMFTSLFDSWTYTTTKAYEGFLRQIMSKLLFSIEVMIDPIFPFSGKDPTATTRASQDRFFRMEIKKRLSDASHHPSDLPTLFESKTSTNGLSLYSIGHWNLIAAQKKKVFQLFINLPLWNLKDYFFHHRTDTTGSDRFHTNYEHDQHINLYQLAPWNIYLTIESSQSWQLSIITLHTTTDGSVSSKTLISITSTILENQKQQRKAASTSSPSSNPFQKNLLQQEIQSSQKIYDILKLEFQEHTSELANGRFSFLEHSSGMGYVSSRLAKQYPNATIFSITHQASQAKVHYEMSRRLQIQNNAICLQDNQATDSLTYQKLYDCPELFRFQLLFPQLLDQFIHKHNDLETWGESMGTVLSTALTSFVYVPNSALVSYGLYLFFGVVYLYRDTRTNRIYSPTDLLHWRHVPQEDQTSIWKHLEPISIQKHTSYRYLEEVVMTPNHDRLSEDMNQQLPPHHDHQPISNLQEYFMKVMYLSAHPLLPYQNFQSEWLLSSARAKKGSTSLLLSPLAVNDQTRMASTRRRGVITQPSFFDFPMIRCDIVNMTRHVHHHYDYSKDGHSRTYTMHIEVNKTESNRVKAVILDPSSAISQVDQQGVHLSLPPPVAGAGNHLLSSASSTAVTLALGHHPSQHNIVSVRLFRDRDDFPIPYISIYGVTLITALRLGLLPEIRERLFHSFLKLPLYEDMAPWNIVLMGSNVDYIDYDTREFTFDNVIPKAYQVMTVLMNYKRTVEDFRKCSGKANTVYGLPYVSDCVGGYSQDKRLDCSSDLRYPVPCSDGKCHSDYISCLRALSDIAQGIAAKEQIEGDKKESDPIIAQMASSMSSVVAKFNPSSYKEINYEEFLNQLTS